MNQADLPFTILLVFAVSAQWQPRKKLSSPAFAAPNFLFKIPRQSANEINETEAHNISQWIKMNDDNDVRDLSISQLHLFMESVEICNIPSGKLT